MSYLNLTFNHFRAIKLWADRYGASIQLDLQTFEVAASLGGRTCRLYPQFLAQVDGRLAYVTDLSAGETGATGAAGWRPYRPLQWELAAHKLKFKEFLRGRGLSTPASWTHPQQATTDYLIKSDSGSFGYEVLGPFVRGGSSQEEFWMNDGQEMYVEQFVLGRNVKAWFWGETPIHLHVFSYPYLTGDGESNVQQLLDTRLKTSGDSLTHPADQRAVRLALGYQGLQLTDIPSQGRQFWPDFRYGRIFRPRVLQFESDSVLPEVSEAVTGQLELIGRNVHQELMAQLGVPVLYSVDGVIDADEKLWWLEINSNPMFPPTGYFHMFSSLFGTPVNTNAATQLPQVRQHAALTS